MHKNHVKLSLITLYIKRCVHKNKSIIDTMSFFIDNIIPKINFSSSEYNKILHKNKNS